MLLSFRACTYDVFGIYRIIVDALGNIYCTPTLNNGFVFYFGQVATLHALVLSTGALANSH